MVPIWKTSELLDARGDNNNERDGNWRFGMRQQKMVEKENKFTLGTEKCENIKNLYINK